MKILVDENMPYAVPLFSQLGNVHAVSGRLLSSQDVCDADALMVRSITKVNETLLRDSAVKFVGTATAGYDHIDSAYLSQAGIGFSSAPGCNAIAVVEYVFSALMLLAERDRFDLRDRTVGIVGVGNVGSRLASRLTAWGVETLLCDPPRAENGDEGSFHTLETVVREADILTFHTPLNRDGKYKTTHLVDETLLDALPAGRVLVNASRGAVIDNTALHACLTQGKPLRVILDVWENEPHILLPLMENVDIATPHIAGYSLEGKSRGTTQVFEAYSAFLGTPRSVELTSLLPTPVITEVSFNGELTQDGLKRLIHLVYDVRRDDALLRAVASYSGEFDQLRKHYYERREWSSLCVRCNTVQTAIVLTQLGFNAV